MISAVVPFYANPKLHTHVRFSLPLCLQPLVEHAQIKEIILIDDGSPFDVNIAKSPKIRYYSIAHHGVGYARNFGVTKATQPYILVLDSDIIISNRLIEAFIAALKKGADIACVSFVESYIQSVWAKCEELYWKYNETRPNKWWLSCGCMLVKREVFNKVKFRSDTFSDEDTLFSRDVRRLHLKVVTLPLTAKHVFAVDLKSLKRKWYYGGKRAAISKTRTLYQAVKSLFYSPFFAFRLAIRYRYPPLIPFIIIRTVTFLKGFISAAKSAYA
ncbi:MAG: glycosyltransferase [Candidatus Bathyarchaeota archaeon]|nr:glycosyltransferase [Candidatus Bathyarchaeota archaeon]